MLQACAHNTEKLFKILTQRIYNSTMTFKIALKLALAAKLPEEKTSTQRENRKRFSNSVLLWGFSNEITQLQELLYTFYF